MGGGYSHYSLLSVYASGARQQQVGDAPIVVIIVAVIIHSTFRYDA